MKYFIGYEDNEEIRNLCIFFPEMGAYKRFFDKTKYMYCMIDDEIPFDKYMTFCKNVSSIIKTKFNSELIYNKFYIKAEKRLIQFIQLIQFIENFYPKVFLDIEIYFSNSDEECYYGNV